MRRRADDCQAGDAQTLVIDLVNETALKALGSGSGRGVDRFTTGSSALVSLSQK